MALDLNVDFLGFILHEQSPRFVSIPTSLSLRNSMELGKAKSVAVQVNPTPKELENTKNAGFDFFQLHFNPFADRRRISDWSRIVGKDRLWLAPRLNAESTIPEDIFSFANTILVDGYSKDRYGGTGKVADWSSFNQCQKMNPEIRWMLAGGLGPQNIRQAIQQASPAGVDLNSGIEESPGIKSRIKLKETIQTISKI